MAKSAWKKFPYSDKAYDYAGPALKKAWSALHRGDCEPFPDEAWVKKAIEAHPKLDPKMPPAKAAEALQSAWRAYHAGDFAAAAEQGEAALNLNPIVRSLVEQRLAHLNLDPGPTDGVFDDNTRRAIRRYQQARNLPATGYLSQQTLVRLLADSL